MRVRLGPPGRRAGLGPQEGELVGVVLNLLVHADAGRVPAGEAVMQQDGPAAR